MDFTPSSSTLKLLPPLELLLSLNSNIHFHWFFCCDPFLTFVLPPPINTVTIGSPVPYYLLIFLNNYNVFPTNFSASTLLSYPLSCAAKLFPSLTLLSLTHRLKTIFFTVWQSIFSSWKFKKSTICPQSTFLTYLLPSPLWNICSDPIHTKLGWSEWGRTCASSLVSIPARQIHWGQPRWSNRY